MDFNIHVIPDPVNFLLQLVATLILFAVVRHFLYTPVKNLISKRKELVAGNLAAAEEQKEQVAKLKSEYEQSLLGAQREAKEIIDESRERGEQLKQQIIDDAQVEVRQIKASAHKDIERAREDLQREMKDQIAGIAMLVASKVIEKNLDTQVQKDLIDGFIDEVGGSQWQK